MNRRGFIRAIGVAIAAIVVSPFKKMGPALGGVTWVDAAYDERLSDALQPLYPQYYTTFDKPLSGTCNMPVEIKDGDMVSYGGANWVHIPDASKYVYSPPRDLDPLGSVLENGKSRFANRDGRYVVVGLNTWEQSDRLHGSMI